MKKKKSIAKTGVIYAMLATIFARGLGFIRELLVASTFGTTATGDAFIVAFTIPELLANGFGVAIGTLYIPIYYKIKNKEKNTKLIDEFNSNVSVILIAISISIIALFLFSPKLVIKLFASGFSNETIDLTIQLTKIIIFSTIPILLAYHFKSYAQIYKRYALTTFLGCIINITIIIAMIFVKDKPIILLAYATLLGNLLYAIILYYIVRKNEFKYSLHLNLKSKYIKALAIGVLPVFVSSIIFEINQIIDKNFASQLSVGTISALNYSSKIINLITAILGTSIASIFFPYISNIYTNGDENKIAYEAERINMIMLAIVIPLFYIVIIFAKQIVIILFGYGNFNNESIIITTQSLQFYSLGIIGFNLKSIWVRIFNAQMDTKTPSINSIIAVICNIAFNIIFITSLKHKGLALATGLASILTNILLIVKFSKVNKYFKLKNFVKELSKIIISSIVLIPFMFIIRMLILQYTFRLFILAIILFIVSLIIYFILLVICRSIVVEAIKKRYL